LENVSIEIWVRHAPATSANKNEDAAKRLNFQASMEPLLEARAQPWLFERWPKPIGKGGR